MVRTRAFQVRNDSSTLFGDDMNDLNSVLMEGTLVSKLELDLFEENEVYLQVGREIKGGTKKNFFIQLFFNEKMEKEIKSSIGKKIRIVGRIDKINNKIGAYIEHLEVKRI